MIGTGTDTIGEDQTQWKMKTGEDSLITDILLITTAIGTVTTITVAADKITGTVHEDLTPDLPIGVTTTNGKKNKESIK